MEEALDLSSDRILNEGMNEFFCVSGSFNKKYFTIPSHTTTCISFKNIDMFRSQQTIIRPSTQ